MGKGVGRSNGFLPNSIRIISSCLKTVSTNAGTAVRSAGASVAASIAAVEEDQRDQVLWAGFDKLELGPTTFRHVLLLGYSDGFQVVDIEDASNVRELVSKRDGPVTFLQIQPIPDKLEGHEGYRESHPLLLVVAGDETNGTSLVQGGHLGVPTSEPQPGHGVPTPTAVRFYSLKSDSYVHVLRFRSAVYMIRCSSRIIAVALAAQIYCFDAITLETKFSVLTYPMLQGGQGVVGVNIGYGPMAVGPRWLAYASNTPLLSNTGRLSPQNLTPSPGVSPSTSPSSGNFVARYAMESGKQLAAGIINLGDIGYKTLSKYYQDLLPDGSSSPVSPSSSWKVGKVTSAAHPSEADNAGMVVVKDFISKAIVSQFRAHTSPISALCFDPTGTLLVTASVHGHNINVFRIMPSRVQSASDTACYDWSSSHVHLFKLYRGLTAAVIQDICFSHYSQWVAIVSSRGTCHIFVLFPFGGDVGLHTQSAYRDGPSLLPSLSLPWWSTSSFMTNQQPRPPPPPVTLSVVSRIKNGNLGWLNTVSNAAASATGKVSAPSGAVAAVFHNSIYKNLQPIQLKCNALEHLIVYSPSGHLIQHDLLPSSGIESCDDSFRSGLSQSAPVQDEELRVRAEPIQWWDVCRRSNWPEREESFSGMTFDGFETAEVVMDTSDCEDNDTMYSASYKNTLEENHVVKTHEKTHWYLSNAEVQISSGRIPIWQKSKICVYTMIPSEADVLKFENEYSVGEIEIEKIPVHEVEIKRKDLLPVFEHFQSIPSGWIDRGLVRGRNPSFSSSSHLTNDKFMEGAGFSRSKSAPLGSIERSDVGTARTSGNLLDLDQTNQVGPYGPTGLQSMETQISHQSLQCSVATTNLKKELNSEKRGSIMPAILPQLHTSNGFQLQSKSFSDQESAFILSELSDKGDGFISGLSSLDSNSMSVGRADTKGALSSSNSLGSEVSNTSGSDPFDLGASIQAETEHGDSHNSRDFAQCFHEGYCKISELDDCRELAEVVNDADSSSSHCEREKPEGGGDNDDMLGGVFAFCEEG
ncbi:autophagy-related protein 18h-like protein isoform X1 [Cinnamomum micranthum f. kanehirae]|uniref:Autophagy-related protein 18h-like protein isoform X1 n=1 Tax=Cinnamomum micranthum f. kanehirae TaxID=337451 RepID=A0A443NDN5_9MAGN|nr:autophagy-related protein 18h-like protein isoform X1 [Cinnamomum micranthum f. kanehirae]